MRAEKMVMVLSIIAGLLFWCFDSLLDYLFFYEGTFWGLLISDVPAHEAYHRLVVMAVLAMFGLIVSRMVSKRRQAEEALASANANMTTLLSTIPAFVYLKDAELKFVATNRAQADLVGVTPEEMVGRSDLDFFPKKQAEAYRTDDANVIATGQPLVDREEPVTDKNGNRLWVLTNKRPILAEDGRIAGLVGLTMDITKRKRAEEAARKAREQLAEQQRREKERVGAELAKVRDELVRKTRLAAIGQVSASIAHDLRNPLGVARNAVYYLCRGGAKDESRLAEYLEIIDQEIGVADRIIGKLLEMARTAEPAKQAVDLGQVVYQVLDAAKAAQGVRCRTAMCPEPFVVQADPDQWRQLIDNLLSNAVHAMEGRGEFLVEATRGPDGNTIVFRDTGPGIAAEIRPHVFEPLVTNKAIGTGLGLTICREIVERHGGTIETIHHKQGGAAFRIRLPRG